MLRIVIKRKLSIMEIFSLQYNDVPLKRRALLILKWVFYEKTFFAEFFYNLTLFKGSNYSLVIFKPPVGRKNYLLHDSNSLKRLTQGNLVWLWWFFHKKMFDNKIFVVWHL